MGTFRGLLLRGPLAVSLHALISTGKGGVARHELPTRADQVAFASARGPIAAALSGFGGDSRNCANEDPAAACPLQGRAFWERRARAESNGAKDLAAASPPAQNPQAKNLRVKITGRFPLDPGI